MALEGVFIAAVTPFKNDEVDYSAYKKNIQKWCETDISGILVLGSTSEFVTLNTEEKVRVLAMARENIPANKTMIAGIGCESVVETVNLGHKATELGIEHLIVVNPHYYKPLLKEEVLYTYFQSVADQVTAPILLYNIPRFTGVDLSIGLIQRLAQHENIVGIKDSTGNLVQYLGLVDLDNFTVFTGDINSFVQTNLMGVNGGIFAFSNATPQEICDVYKMVKQNDASEAIKKHKAIMRLAQSSVGKYGLAGLKKLMEIIGFSPGDPRLPFKPVSEEVEVELKEAYENFKTEF